MTRYRIDRAHVMVTVGSCFIVAAIAVVIAFLSANSLLWLSWATGVLAVIALCVAARLAWRPPTVLILDGAGLHAKGRHGDVTWRRVEDFGIVDSNLTFQMEDDSSIGFPLNLVQSGQRATLVREIYDRLNEAHGYRRFDPAS